MARKRSVHLGAKWNTRCVWKNRYKIICHPDVLSSPVDYLLLPRWIIQSLNFTLRWYTHLIDDKSSVLSCKGELIMVHHPVRSSRIASIAYDERSATLEIRFVDRRTLQYQRVPARIYNDFCRLCLKGDSMMAWWKENLPKSKCSASIHYWGWFFTARNERIPTTPSLAPSFGWFTPSVTSISGKSKGLTPSMQATFYAILFGIRAALVKRVNSADSAKEVSGFLRVKAIFRQQVFTFNHIDSW